MTPHAPADWRRTDLPVDQRIEALLTEMTLEEKVAQLTGYWFDRRDAGQVVAPMQDTLGAGRPPFENVAPRGLGHFTRVIGTTPDTTVEVRRRLRDRQRELITQSRLGLPAIAHEECLTGVNAVGATVYPAPLSWGAMFDPALVQRISATIGSDLRALGVHQGLSPVLDVVRDYRWGRVEETIGEDPVLVGTVGAAYVRGLEQAGVIATLKHFVGYSGSASGRNHAPVSAGPRELTDILLVPFELALRDGDARSVMNSYSDIDGMPVAADRTLLTDLLRTTWGFTGTVVSDYWAIPFLATAHGVAADGPDAGVRALEAGMDVELPNGMCFPPLTDAVASGRIAEELVDRSVHRILQQKMELGLLEPDFTAELDAEVDDDLDLDRADNRALAREAAEAAIVLLRNENSTLPLDPGFRGSIAVIGPAGDTPRAFLGCYSYPVHVLPRHPEYGLGLEVASLTDAVRDEFPAAHVVHSRGADFLDDDVSGIPAAVEAALAADIVILAVGDLPGMFGRGTSGEGCDVDELALPGGQAALVDAITATGKPVILVTNSGRPYAFAHSAQSVPAAVQAFIPGEEAASAIAGVLSGRVNPSAKLPVQIPRTRGGAQHLYLGAPLTRTIDKISNLSTTPAFPFGHGLSYSAFRIDAVSVTEDRVSSDGTTTLSLTVTNTSGRAGAEVVQLYVSDPLAQIARPVRKLVGYAKVALDAGAGATVTFTISPELAAYSGADMQRRVDTGTLVFAVGSSSEQLAAECAIEVTGSDRLVGTDRMIVAPVDVQQG